MREGFYPEGAPDSGRGLKTVKIDGEEVKCEVIDLYAVYGEALKTADRFRKTAIVEARQAAKREIVSTGQDGTENVAEAGDWIIKNPGDKDPYVFGNKTDPLEVRQQKFTGKYEATPDEPGKFRPKGIIRALQVDRNIVFSTSWGEMAVRAGGWVTDGGYGIAKQSLADSYEKIKEETEE